VSRIMVQAVVVRHLADILQSLEAIFRVVELGDVGECCERAEACIAEALVCMGTPQDDDEDE
jgi:hypothetical protein